MSFTELARIARAQRIAFVVTDYDGPLQRTLECLTCGVTWRIFLDRFGGWPPDWCHCPNHENHPPEDGAHQRPEAAA